MYPVTGWTAVLRSEAPFSISCRLCGGLQVNREGDQLLLGKLLPHKNLTASIRISGAHLPAMTWREYHEATKHSVESLRRARHVLDWANMPDPFRHYEGVPVLDLPADPPAPEIPALDVLLGTLGSTSVGDGPTLLSQLLFYSAAISASSHGV